jgi:hypothetical protein
MRGTKMEKEVQIYATNLANKTKCNSNNEKMEKIGKTCSFYRWRVKPEHLRLKSYGNP